MCPNLSREALEPKTEDAIAAATTDHAANADPHRVAASIAIMTGIRSNNVVAACTFVRIHVHDATCDQKTTKCNVHRRTGQCTMNGKFTSTATLASMSRFL